MKTARRHKKRPALKLLVLVPHPDIRLPLRAMSSASFAAGLHGAWSFPQVAPLALLRQPLSPAELKALAAALREHINNSGGKIICGPQTAAAIPVCPDRGKTLTIFGPSLQTKLPGSFFDHAVEAVTGILPLVIGSAVTQPADCVFFSNTERQEDIVGKSFRAAALANMVFRPLSGCGGWDGYSFEWNIGKLYWLPKTKKRASEVHV